MSEQNKEIFRRYVEQVNQRNLNIIDETIAVDYINHDPNPGQTPGPEGLRKSITGMIAAFPDLQITIEDLLAEGDRIVARVVFRGTHGGNFMGNPATGKQFAVQVIEIFRVADGKLREAWVESDRLVMMQQLGLMAR